jgi:hypothetical protein
MKKLSIALIITVVLLLQICIPVFALESIKITKFDEIKQEKVNQVGYSFAKEGAWKESGKNKKVINSPKNSIIAVINKDDELTVIVNQSNKNKSVSVQPASSYKLYTCADDSDIDSAIETVILDCNKTIAAVNILTTGKTVEAILEVESAPSNSGIELLESFRDIRDDGEIDVEKLIRDIIAYSDFKDVEYNYNNYDSEDVKKMIANYIEEIENNGILTNAVIAASEPTWVVDRNTIRTDLCTGVIVCYESRTYEYSTWSMPEGSDPNKIPVDGAGMIEKKQIAENYGKWAFFADLKEEMRYGHKGVGEGNELVVFVTFDPALLEMDPMLAYISALISMLNYQKTLVNNGSFDEFFNIKKGPVFEDMKYFHSSGYIEGKENNISISYNIVTTDEEVKP